MFLWKTSQFYGIISQLFTKFPIKIANFINPNVK